MPIPDLSAPFAEIAVRATVVLIGALGLALVLRKASGATRHALWTATTGALLALPLLQGTLPRIAIEWIPAPEVAAPLPASTLAVLPPARGPIGQVVEQVAATEMPTLLPETKRGPDLGVALTLAWLLGLFGCALPVLIGHLRARRVIREAERCHDGRLLVRFVAAAHAVGVRETVVLSLSGEIRTPMTGGLLRPVVLLPTAALGWSDECLDTVMRHELVHVRQRDALRQLASRLSVALYWFHPLAWRAAGHAALAREQACDEAVVGLGTRPSRYARHLLELADPLDPSALAVVPALVRLDHPHLEERVMAILRDKPAPVSRRQTMFGTAAIAAWTVGVAAIGPAQAQVPLAPSAPAAQIAVAAPAPAAPSAERTAPTLAEGALPLPSLPPAGVLAVPAPLPPLAPLPAVPGAYDCEFDGRGYRTGSADRDTPVRMHSSTVDGIRICAAVRGRSDETASFLPTGRLAVGVSVTLASSGPDGTQRLVIEGTPSGNVETWTVNDRERPFDAAAAEWRDAMVAVVRASIEKSQIRGQEARLRGEIARARSDDARVQGRIARIQGETAAVRARAAAADAEVALLERRAPRADVEAVNAARMAQAERQIAEVRAADEVRVAEVEARRAEVEARVASGGGRSGVAVGRREREVVEASRATGRARARAEVDEVRARQELEEVRVRGAGERAVTGVQAREVAERQRAVVEARAAENERRIREVRAAGVSADVTGRVSRAEREIEQVQAERRIAEIEAGMTPLEARLRAAIRRVGN